eukprot:jgi/Hompol1/1315/HPOL_005556-RA
MSPNSSNGNGNGEGDSHAGETTGTNDFSFAVPAPRSSALNVQQPPIDVPPLPYTPPDWSHAPQDDIYFEVLKNGAIIDQTPLFRKEFIVFGRLPVCDVGLDHQV